MAAQGKVKTTEAQVKRWMRNELTTNLDTYRLYRTHEISCTALGEAALAEFPTLDYGPEDDVWDWAYQMAVEFGVDE